MDTSAVLVAFLKMVQHNISAVAVLDKRNNVKKNDFFSGSIVGFPGRPVWAVWAKRYLARTVSTRASQRWPCSGQTVMARVVMAEHNIGAVAVLDKRNNVKTKVAHASMA